MGLPTVPETDMHVSAIIYYNSAIMVKIIPNTKQKHYEIAAPDGMKVVLTAESARDGIGGRNVEKQNGYFHPLKKCYRFQETMNNANE